MRFTQTKLAGVILVESVSATDERGSFARAYCESEFAAASLNTKWPQHNISHNARQGTLRGMHFQIAPYEEIKLVRCVAGAIFDVVVDIRKTSSTYGRWDQHELSAKNGNALYIPYGFAHGFQTLVDNSTVLYFMSEIYQPQSARGIIWNDPDIGIAWPLAPSAISEQDRQWLNFNRRAQD